MKLDLEIVPGEIFHEEGSNMTIMILPAISGDIINADQTNASHYISVYSFTNCAHMCIKYNALRRKILTGELKFLMNINDYLLESGFNVKVEKYKEPPKDE